MNNTDSLNEMKDLWWGYKHISGSYQAKRYFDKRDTDEAEESPFCEQVVYPFKANSREGALSYIREVTN